MSSSTDDRVIVGRVGRPHGLRGEVTVVPETDDSGRFSPGSTLLAGEDRDLTVESAVPYRDRGLLVRFAGVDSREEAEALRGTLLQVDRSQRRRLDEGEFWSDDLVGLAAVDPGGAVLGTVSAVEFGPGQDRLVVNTPSGVEVLVPFVADIVGDPEGGRITIAAPKGLFP